MARNEEKAQAMLNRWWKQKSELHKKTEGHMPHGKRAISQVSSINECERWRNSLLRDISKKVTKIQNAGLGEKVIRDLNDLINKLLREVRMFEDRILELGGTNYRRVMNALMDMEGSELPGFGGYKYFGAAKDLPGVRELFQKEVPDAPQRSLVEVYKSVDFDYYFGKKIENREDIEAAEKSYEDRMRVEELQKWAAMHQDTVKIKTKGKDNPTTEELWRVLEEEAYADVREAEQEEVEEQGKLFHYQENLNIERETKEAQRIAELNARKKELLDQYLSKIQDE